jgi:hypothetical protein
MPGAALTAIALIIGAALLRAARVERPSSAALPLGLLVLATAFHALAYDSLQDDAFISFRYARNWAEGLGPVFNPGERVEGYSNFLLVALLSAAHGLLGVGVVEAAIFIGLMSALATPVLVYRYAKELCDGSAEAGLLAATCVAGAACFAAYARSGLETTLYCLLVVATLDCALRGGLSRAGGLAALATLARPDGIIVFAAIAAGALERGPLGVRAIARITAGYAALIVPWTLWRVLYYGYLIPNQIVAKSGMEPARQLMLGLEYLARGLLANLPFVLLGGVALAAIVRGRAVDRLARRDVSLAVAFIGAAAFPVATGGDWMPAYRMLVPAVVLGCVLLARLWQIAELGPALGAGSRAAAALFAAAAVAAVSIGVYEPRMLRAVDMLREIVAGEVQVGRWLHRRLPPETLTAAWANGAIPFHSRLPTIDLLGLTDEHISRRGERRADGRPGHIAHDHAYVIGRQPALITYLGGAGLSYFPSLRMITEYADDYAAVSFELSRRASANVFANFWVLKAEREPIVSQLIDEQHGIRLLGPDEIRRRRSGR